MGLDPRSHHWDLYVTFPTWAKNSCASVCVWDNDVVGFRRFAADLFWGDEDLDVYYVFKMFLN